MNRRARKCEMQSTVEIASGVKLLGNRWKKGSQYRNAWTHGTKVCVCVYVVTIDESHTSGIHFLSPFFISVNIVIFENIFIFDTKNISTSRKNFIIKIPFRIEIDSEERRIGFYTIYICTSNAWYEKDYNRKLSWYFYLIWLRLRIHSWSATCHDTPCRLDQPYVDYFVTITRLHFYAINRYPPEWRIPDDKHARREREREISY